MKSNLFPNRREFLVVAATCVSATPLAAVCVEIRSQDLPYLGRSLREWIDALGDESPESSHVVEALAAYGRPALTAALQRSFQTSCAVSERRLRRLFHLIVSRDLGIIDDLLKASADDPWQAYVCLDFCSPFVDRSPVVVQALQKEAAHSDYQGRCSASELLLDAGIPVPLAALHPAVLEYEAHHQCGDRSDDSYYRAYSLELMSVLLRAEGGEQSKGALFERVKQLRGRLDDQESAVLVPYLRQCGEWGHRMLVDYAASTLRETGRLACESLSLMTDRLFPTVRSLAASAEKDQRIAAFRILSRCSAATPELLDLARRNLVDRDLGVSGLAALTLIRNQVDQDRAESVLAGTLRCPELRYRRWIMEGLSGFVGPVNAVDRRLMKLVNDDDEDTRFYAMRRIRQLRIDSPEMIQLVGEIGRGRAQSDGLRRAEAFEYLVEIGEAAIPIARKALAAGNLKPHHELIRLFGRLGPSAVAAAPELVACWRFSDSWKRGEILQSLYGMKAYSQLWPLVAEALNEEDAELFGIAAATLPAASRSDFARLWPLVRKGLRSHHCEIQNAAAFAVSNHGSEAMTDLLSLLNSEDPYDRLGATKGLKLCPNENVRVREALQKAKVDPDWAVRMSAAGQLVE